ncbi:hypothetical protein [Paraburkholderia youngii]|uniref:Uncharacterized protein n=1 Tax=Paraburkholderia youngii TaxID=2782701 RepID=A0A7Y6MZR0_9BURK|nr:hypothetical protein [Paraburkholderia youngii]NUY00286.1 hypothetical protein [Paraburkholderia youngii]
MCEHPARFFWGASQRDFNDYVVRRYVIDTSPLEQFEAEAFASMRIPPGEIGRPTSGIFSPAEFPIKDRKEIAGALFNLIH